MSVIHILGFSGSLRQSSYNTRLLHLAAERLPTHATLEIFDLAPLPLYNQDLEDAGRPQVVQEFRGKIDQADALLIASPEYMHSITGALKNALDWASRGPSSPLNQKPTAIMGAGGRFGTVRAQMHLRQILTSSNTPVLARPDLHIIGAHRAFDEDGNLIDEVAYKQLGDLVNALVEWVTKIKQPA